MDLKSKTPIQFQPSYLLFGATSQSQSEPDVFDVGATIREVLTENRTYYVRTDGNNANNGLTDSAGGAWATIQHALDYIINNVEPSGKVITIQLNAGTHVGFIVNSASHRINFGGVIRVIGDVSNAANVTISRASTFCNCGIEYVYLHVIMLGMTFQCNTMLTFYASGVTSRLTIGHDPTGIYGPYSTDIRATGTPSTNAAQAIFFASEGGWIDAYPLSFTLDATGPIRTFMRGSRRGLVEFSPDNFTNAQAVTINTAGIVLATQSIGYFLPLDKTLTGAFTGKRYDVQSLALLFGASEADLTFGSTAGTTAAGGIATA